MNRRDFLALSAGATAALVLRSSGRPEPAPGAMHMKQPRIPRWRGFNLTELVSGRRGQAFHESDFAWMEGWGFNFARLPCSYWSWSSPKDWMAIDEAALKPLDDAITLGRRHNVHVNVCLHRIPGYCVNGRDREPHQLFDSSPEDMQLAMEAAVHHWRTLARRYRAIPSSALSFDLFNEPPFMRDQLRYVAIARVLIAAIRAESPDRLIFADGADLGQTPVPDLVDEEIVQSTRGYLPKMVSHYTATWVPRNEFESLRKPTWPMVDDKGVRWDRAHLRRVLMVKWQPLAAQGVPIHVGEWGCFNRTPHDVCLAWMRDLLSLWREAGWGWSMWNLRGAFGPVDSGREDVAYEDLHGHKLDRQMLELLRAG